LSKFHLGRGVIEMLQKLNTNKIITVSVFATIVAFAVMIIFSYSYASRVVRNYLEQTAIGITDMGYVQLEIALQEPHTAISIVSETVRRMILDNVSEHYLHEYIEEMTNFLLAQENPVVTAKGFFGYIHRPEGNIFLLGADFTPPENFDPTTRLWYIDSAYHYYTDEVFQTNPFVDIVTQKTAISFARNILDEEGNRIGVIGLDVAVSHIAGFMENLQLMEDSRNVIIDSNGHIVVSEDITVIGTHISMSLPGLYVVMPHITFGREVSGYRFIYNDNVHLVFTRTLSNGWTFLTFIPEIIYYQSIQDMLSQIVFMGVLLAAVLVVAFIIMNVRSEKFNTESQAKSRFLAHMSHEVRTPLNSIIGMTQIALTKNQLDSQIEGILLQISTSSKQLLAIVNDILDLSKVETGKMKIIEDTYDTASVVNDTIQFTLHHLTDKPVKFNVNIDPNLPKQLFGDEIRVKQVISNLLSNAMKYTTKGFVNLSISLKHDETLEKSLLSVTIKDSGQGMTKEQVNTLLTQEYIRFNEVQNQHIQGTGLGMSITRQIVGLMGGKLVINSELGKGTSVKVILPQDVVDQTPIGVHTSDNLSKYYTESAIKDKEFEYDKYSDTKILLVDDVESNLVVASGLLAPYGFEIETVQSGQECINKVKNGSLYDIIFMDHMMPEMNGIETTNELRRIRYNEPVVALTANALTGQEQVFKDNGFQGFIAKPIELKFMDKCIRSLLRHKHLEKVSDKKSFKKNENVSEAIVSAFLKDAQKIHDILKKLMEENTWSETNLKQFRIHIHGIKTGLANVHYMELSKLAELLENSVIENDVTYITKNTPSFLQELQTIMDNFSYQKEGLPLVVDSLPKGSSKMWLRALHCIRVLCEEYDKSTIISILSNLDKYIWQDDITIIIGRIRELLLHSEFEEVELLVEQAIG